MDNQKKPTLHLGARLCLLNLDSNLFSVFLEGGGGSDHVQGRGYLPRTVLFYERNAEALVTSVELIIQRAPLTP